MKKYSQSFVLFILFIASGLWGADVPYQIYPANQAIEVETRPGYRYTHIEGDQPDWRLGIIRQEALRSDPVTGNGHPHSFTADAGSGYHMVEEHRAEGNLSLRSVGAVRKAYRYNIRQGNVNFLEGEVRESELASPPNISLPYGEYTFQAVATGCSTPEPIRFAVTEEQEKVDLAVELHLLEIALYVTTDPPGIADGRPAIVRLIDPEKQRAVWQRQVIIGEAPLTVEEGQYTVEFPNIDGFRSPGGSGIVGRFHARQGAEREPIVGTYSPLPGKIFVTYKTDLALAKKLHDVRFWLIDASGHRVQYPLDGRYQENALSNERTVVISDLTPGEYRLEFVVEGRELDPPEAQLVTVERNGVAYLDQFLSPAYGRIRAESHFTTWEPDQPTPAISLRDAGGALIDGSDDGTLDTGELLPGEYTVYFEEIANYQAPDPVPLVVRPGVTVGPIVGRYELGTGTLHVHFSTGQKGERLQEVQFLLVDRHGEKTRYPRGGDVTEDPQQLTRQVAIEDLTVGSYQIEFEVPNKDHLFEPIPPQRVTISKGDVTQLQQLIEPRYGSIEVSAFLPERAASGEQPEIQVTTPSGKLVESGKGYLIARNLIPGEYIVTFEELDAYETPERLQIWVDPHETAGPYEGPYTAGYGSLEVVFNTGEAYERLDRVRFWLINPDGSRQMFPSREDTDYAENGRDRRVVIPRLAVGTYDLEWLIPNADNLFQEVERGEFSIEKGDTTRYQQHFVPQYASLEASVALATAYDKVETPPSITLIDPFGEVVVTSDRGSLTEERLVPGEYQLHFGDIPQFTTPEPIAVVLHPNQKSGPVVGEYSVASGRAVIAYDTGPTDERLGQVRFWITDPDGRRSMHPQEDELELTDAPGREVVLRDLSVGRYRLEFFVPNIDGLFSDVEQSTFEVTKDETTYIQQEITPNYAGIEVSLTFPYSEPPAGRMPTISVRDIRGEIVTQSQSGFLKVQHLTPGDYDVYFEDIPGEESPEPITLHLSPNEFAGPLVKEVRIGTGDIVIDYQTGSDGKRIDEVQFALISQSDPSQVYTSQEWRSKNEVRQDGRRVTFRDVPVGEYVLDSVIRNDDGLFAEVDREEFVLRDGDELSFRREFRPQYGGVEITAELDSEYGIPGEIPKLRLVDSDGQTVAHSEKGHLFAGDLAPGQYKVYGEPLNYYEVPDPKTITVRANEIAGPLALDYQTGRGELVVTYQTDDSGEALDEVRFWLIDQRGEKRMYPAEGEQLRLSSSERQVTVPDLPSGRYKVQFFVPQRLGLFDEAEPEEVSLEPGEQVALTKRLQPRWSALEAGITFSPAAKQPKQLPLVTLTDEFGKIVAQKIGSVSIDRLPPGDYRILYGEADDFLVPEAEDIHVEADSVYGPITGSYHLSSGAAVISYDTGDKGDQIEDVRFTLTGDNGITHEFSSEDALSRASTQESHREVVIDHLPAGTYTLAYHLPQGGRLFSDVAEETLQISGGSTVKHHTSLHPRYGSVMASVRMAEKGANIDYQPTITLRDEFGTVRHISRDGQLSALDLAPGKYRVEFERMEGFSQPDSIDVELGPDENIGPFYGEYDASRGKVVINYKTGEKGERLDRIRFWLIDSENNWVMYPIAGSPPLTTKDGGRQVVINSVEEGNYRLEFLVPNGDGLFQDIPEPEFTVIAGEVIDVDITINPRYGSVRATAIYPEDRAGQPMPRMWLIDTRTGKSVAETNDGVFHLDDVVPGKYRLKFEEMDGYRTPEERTIEVAGGEIAGPFMAVYGDAFGSLMVSYNTGGVEERIDRVRFWILDEEGNYTNYKSQGRTERNPATGDYQVIIPKVAIGRYTIEWFVPNLDGLFHEVPPRQFEIVSGDTTKIEQPIRPQYAAMNVYCELPPTADLGGQTPTIWVHSSKGELVGVSNDGQITLDKLLPDVYEVTFQQFEQLDTPDPKRIVVRAGEKHPSVVGEYTSGNGKIVVIYATGEEKERLDEVQMYLRDERGKRFSYPVAPEITEEGLTHGYRVTLREIPVGTYTLALVVPNDDSLFNEMEDLTFLVERGETVTLTRQLKPRYGSIEILAKLPDGLSELDAPKVILKGRSGQFAASSENGVLKHQQLLPGEYTIVWGENEKLYAPEPSRVTIAPDEVAGPYLGKYIRAVGTVKASFRTDEHAVRIEEVEVVLRDEIGEEWVVSRHQEEMHDIPDHGKAFIVKDLPTGWYDVTFDIPNDDNLFEVDAESYRIYVPKGDLARQEHTFVPRYSSFEAVAVFADEHDQAPGWPTVTLVDEGGNERARSKNGRLSALELIPGAYTVKWEDIFGFAKPDDAKVTLVAGEVAGPVIGEYFPATGRLEVVYYTNGDGILMDRIQFALTNSKGERNVYPGGAITERDRETGGIKAMLKDLKVGTYTIEWLLPETDGLLPAVEPKEIYVNYDQTVRYQQPLTPRFGGVEATIKLPPSGDLVSYIPVATLKDLEGNELGTSRDGYLLALEVPPGEYTLEFEDVGRFFTPEPQRVFVAPNDVSGPFTGTYTPATGGIEVAFHTGREEARMGAVNFWITDENGERIVITDSGRNILRGERTWRQTAINELPTGEYTIGWTVADPEGLFEDVESKMISVYRGDVTHVTQAFEPLYGELRATLAIDDELEHSWLSLAEHFEGKDGRRQLPKITLKNALGEVVAQSATGELDVVHLVPGDYEVSYEDLPPVATPEVVAVHVGQNDSVGPIHHTYRSARGQLEVAFSVGDHAASLDDVTFTLTDPNGKVVDLPRDLIYEDDPETGMRHVVINDLVVGNYSVDVTVPDSDGLFLDPRREWIEVRKEQLASLEQEFYPRYGGIDAAIAFTPDEKFREQMPRILLVTPEGEIAAESGDGRLWSEKIRPGQYLITFDDTKTFYAPEPIPVTVDPKEVTGPITGEYRIGRGTLEIAYDTGPLRERIDRVRFWLIDEDGNRTMYPKSQDFEDLTDSAQRMVTIHDVPIGPYQIEWVLPNQDNLFLPVDKTAVVVEKDEQVAVEQPLPPQYGSIEIAYNIDQNLTEDSPLVRLVDTFGEVIEESSFDRFHADNLVPGEYDIVFVGVPGFDTPDPVHLTLLPAANEGPVVGQYNVSTVALSIRMNREDKQWTLYRDGETIQSGVGTRSALLVPPGEGYYLDAEPLEGHEVVIDPGATFALVPGVPKIAAVDYKREFGYLTLRSRLPDGEIATVRVHTPEGELVWKKSVPAANGKLVVEGQEIPIGEYRVSLGLPDYFAEVEVQDIEILKLDTVTLTPSLLSKRALHVSANALDARYILTASNGESWEGKGEAFEFEHLIPGTYTLSFPKMERDTYFPPQEKKIVISENDDIFVDADYRKAASLVISSNVERYQVKIRQLDGDVIIDRGINSRSEAINVPEGRYEVRFEGLTGTEAARYGGGRPDPVEIAVRSTRPERVHGVYEANKGSLVVTSNIPGATYTVRDVTDDEGLILGRFHGDHTTIPMTYVGKYEIKFEKVPGYQTPEATLIVIKPNERKVSGGHYQALEKVAEVSAGPAIVGDPFGEGADDELPQRTVEIDAFAMGIHPVTNTQYAAWLTRAYRENKLQFETKRGTMGQIKDPDGHLLFETLEADPNSQITAKADGGAWRFLPLEGKEEHPVIEVSWYGAVAYCKDNEARLPTEAEWEKAAGMSPHHSGQPMKKYRYGFGRDNIDRTLANYMHTYSKQHPFTVRTTEVGFYNGINLLRFPAEQTAALRANPRLLESHYGTQVAQSPSGCLDMSGNVREWVSDWYGVDNLKTMADHNPQGPGHGTKKVTKGGCYDSFAYEVRVSAKLPLSPETTDAYTGFRVVLSAE